ncbi:NPCBM/NEW2 domain-containing protein [Prosthecobacter sp.]|jgi:hypothetical protein|uniref:NPCBM/NEW2 domain-containing protein n=1 Tax=Prosthecobacter sp. TaxID=1965333 RepID=UPI0037844618
MSAARLIFVSFGMLLFAPQRAWSWGQPHHAITKGALETLPTWQKELLGAEFEALAAKHCMIPDNVYSDKTNAKFAAMESSPGEVYLQKLHLPQAEQIVNRETLRYFMQKAVDSIKAGKISDAARYMGTICHLIEDFGSPSHTVPGDNQFTLLQQFMPPTPVMEGKLLHGPIENGDFAVSIADYHPQLLGTSVEEASWRLLHRVHEGIINARSTTVPIMQALYAGDAASVEKHQLRAATKDAQIVADAMHTILCIGADRFEAVAKEKCERAGISTFWPMEAVHLYYPQSHFFSAPFWGHAFSNVVMEAGVKAMPLRLRVADKDGVLEKNFAEGISTGMGKALTFHLPKGVYHRFKAMAGLQAGIGDKGRVEFTVLGDGKPLANAIVSGTESAHAFDCDVSSVSLLQLNVVTRGLDPKSNYALWAKPELLK